MASSNDARTGRTHGLSRRDFIRSGLSALAVPVLAGCQLEPFGDPTSEVADPRLTARPGEPSLAPTIGLSSLGAWKYQGGVMYVPESYSPDTPAPLFVALHGAGGRATDWNSYHARAESRGMVFVALDSRDETWDLSTRGNFGPDVESLDVVLRGTFERCRIDPTRIALGGFSDGASYALSLGVANGDLFSHLVAYSPGFWAVAERVGSPSVYISHGTQDSVLPIGTTRSRIVPSMIEAGYDVTFEEFEGDHVVPAAISEAALDWFLAVS
ncbi:MAG: phospholipase [Gemmatimonadota bacterium]|nr:MAG: phospholipase [Gemmatimonadota bacterium]